jgi:hypothetical protein
LDESGGALIAARAEVPHILGRRYVDDEHHEAKASRCASSLRPGSITPVHWSVA